MLDRERADKLITDGEIKDGARSEASELGQADDPLYRIWTLPNIITFIRFMMIPVFFILLLSDMPRIYALIVFILASCTDWIDGQIARRTNSVSKIGQLLDPFVDRFLIGFGVLGICLTDIVPLWMFIIIVGRDLFLLGCTTILKRKAPDAEMRVIYLGKVTTWLLMSGFALTMLGWPLVPSLGILTSPLFPGLTAQAAPLGIWLIYIGIVTSIITAVVYVHRGRKLIACCHG